MALGEILENTLCKLFSSILLFIAVVLFHLSRRGPFALALKSIRPTPMYRCCISRKMERCSDGIIHTRVAKPRVHELQIHQES